ncbi:MAG: NAD(P)(+) transhydrogenase (Re/Si-specific) subunit beta [Deltaproteobacteria bacterium]|nr:NAD(P)(+) transhydrogenase (Re/Si-specific) subunit beta [Deltaproteobacteria bacterium]
MNFWFSLLIDFAIILIFLLGIGQFRAPKSARRGNLTAALALALAGIAIVMKHRIFEPHIVMIALMAGSVAGWRIAMRVNMIQIPAMVAFQHGAGGIAAFLVSFVELTRYVTPGISIGKVSGLLGLVIGAMTFSGSMIASGKLSNVVRQTPWLLPNHNRWTAVLMVLIIIFSGTASAHSEGQGGIYYLVILVILSALLGVVFSIRIGGADMPVLISFLNATAGLAAAFCGVIIESRLLVACGATVAASGSILTLVMCRAMNRNFLMILAGSQGKPTNQDQMIVKDRTLPEPATLKVDERSLSKEALKKDPFSVAIETAKEAKQVIIVPGYGMALAQAQFEVKELANLLEQSGKQVKFAIHPVAGRMPGHMNVLLAEAEVPYDKLYEMNQINDEFKETDLVIIIGACDVVNPAATRMEETPISGMPILMTHEAKNVVVCNFDDKPGYSGVENPLYTETHAILLLGDAKDTLGRLIRGLSADSGIS